MKKQKWPSIRSRVFGVNKLWPQWRPCSILIILLLRLNCSFLFSLLLPKDDNPLLLSLRQARRFLQQKKNALAVAQTRHDVSLRFFNRSRTLQLLLSYSTYVLNAVQWERNYFPTTITTKLPSNFGAFIMPLTKMSADLTKERKNGWKWNWGEVREKELLLLFSKLFCLLVIVNFSREGERERENTAASEIENFDWLNRFHECLTT